MTPVELTALAASTSLLAGWRLYLVTLVTGLAMKFGYIALPHQLHSLDILTNNWVIGAAAVGTFDSAWDAVHSFIRPLGGALLSAAIIDSADPKWQVISFLLGGGAALVAHSGKAGARTLINASPEPYSNVAVSTMEDVTTGGLLALAIANPIAAALIAAFMVFLSFSLVIKARRVIRQVMEHLGPRERPMKDVTPPSPPAG